jgi:hypothetical protein
MAESRAGRELSDAFLTPRQPKERGNVAWSQLVSERWEDLTMDCMQLLSATSARVSNSVHEETSHVLRRKFNRHALMLDRRRAIWTWGSGTLRRLAHTFSRIPMDTKSSAAR